MCAYRHVVVFQHPLHRVLTRTFVVESDNPRAAAAVKTARQQCIDAGFPAHLNFMSVHRETLGAVYNLRGDDVGLRHAERNPDYRG